MHKENQPRQSCVVLASSIRIVGGLSLYRQQGRSASFLLELQTTTSQLGVVHGKHHFKAYIHQDSRKLTRFVLSHHIPIEKTRTKQRTTELA